MKKERTQWKTKGSAGDVTEDSANISDKIKKWERPDSNEDTSTSRKKPLRAAAGTDVKNKSVCVSGKTNLVGRSRVQTVEEESMAIDLTTGVNVPRPNRRLTNFIFHNADGEPQPVEMIEVKDIFITY